MPIKDEEYGFKVVTVVITVILIIYCYFTFATPTEHSIRGMKINCENICETRGLEFYQLEDKSESFFTNEYECQCKESTIKYRKVIK